MSPIPAVTYEFDDNPPETNLIKASEVNQNFSDLVEVLKNLDRANFGEGEGITPDIFSDALQQVLGVSDSDTNRAGKSIIDAEESRTNVAFGTLTTPDQVDDIVLPADGVIFALFHGFWKGSNATAFESALFLNDEQVKVDGSGVELGVFDSGYPGYAPQVQSAIPLPSSNANSYQTLNSSPLGLVGGRHESAMNVADPVTTGQIIGSYHDDNRMKIGAESLDPGVSAGVCAISAAAGTYDVSVRFKASTGSVTAKKRRLWVWTRSFA